jgi:thiol-disulfide isomerase/thioredoxin
MKYNLVGILFSLVFTISSGSWGANRIIKDNEVQNEISVETSNTARPIAEEQALMNEIPSDIKDLESLKKYLKRFKEEKVVIKVGATWCGPCAKLHPEIEKLAESKKGQIKVVTLDVDNNPELANKLHPPSNPKFNQGTVPAIFEVAMGENPEIKPAKVGFFPAGTKSSQIGDWLKEQR